MPSLQIKKLPANIYHQLKEQAAQHRRGLAQEAVCALAKGLKTEPDNQSRR